MTTQPIYYDPKMPDIAGSYIKGQQAAQNLEYQGALIDQMKGSAERDSQRLAMEQQKVADAKEANDLNLFIQQRQPYYEALLKDPNITQSQIDADLSKDKEYIRKIAPNKAPMFENMQFHKTPKGIATSNLFEVTKQNVGEINGRLPKGHPAYAPGDYVRITTDPSGNTTFQEDTEYKQQQDKLRYDYKKLEDERAQFNQSLSIKKQELGLQAQALKTKNETKTQQTNKRNDQITTGAQYIAATTNSILSGKMTKDKITKSRSVALSKLADGSIRKEDYYKLIKILNNAESNL